VSHPALAAGTSGRALESAIITRPEHIPAAVKQALAPIIGRYVA
jgi:hypothetical protein